MKPAFYIGLALSLMPLAALHAVEAKPPAKPNVVVLLSDDLLFNLKTDPAQQHDLSGDMPERVDQMRKKLLEINASIMADGHDWNE